MQREEAENYLHQKVEAGEVVSPVLPEGIKNYLSFRSNHFKRVAIPARTSSASAV